MASYPKMAFYAPIVSTANHTMTAIHNTGEHSSKMFIVSIVARRVDEYDEISPMSSSRKMSEASLLEASAMHCAQKTSFFSFTLLLLWHDTTHTCFLTLQRLHAHVAQQAQTRGLERKNPPKLRLHTRQRVPD